MISIAKRAPPAAASVDNKDDFCKDNKEQSHVTFRSYENTQQVNGETARTAIQDSRNETHAGGELRNSQQRESAARPMYCTCMNSGGTGRPPTWLMGTWAVNPRRCHVDGRANGQRVLTSRPPEETPTPSVLRVTVHVQSDVLTPWIIDG